MSDSDRLPRALARSYPGVWQVVSAHSPASGHRLYVLRSSTGRWLVARTDCEQHQFAQICVADGQPLQIHQITEDPAFTGLHEYLEQFNQISFLRYRPGKRLTLAAAHREHGPVIVKCISAGAREVFERLRVLWPLREEFAFDISKPLMLNEQGNILVQSRLAGTEPRFNDLKVAIGNARQMGQAAASLHAVRAPFRQTFTIESQQIRSARYIDRISAVCPESEPILRVEVERLQIMAAKLRTNTSSLTPVHGSLHGHQWLRDHGRLALVDFDRACMGDPELDVATFLAQWDFESGATPDAVKSEFTRSYESASAIELDPNLLAFYRAHKHLSKAYKACKSIDGRSRKKSLHRRLSSLKAVLDSVEMAG